MEIENGQIVIETRVDAKEYIDSRMQEILALRADIGVIQATIDVKISELQELNK
jgi:flagellin-like hook-associated protein FlgL